MDIREQRAPLACLHRGEGIGESTMGGKRASYKNSL